MKKFIENGDVASFVKETIGVGVLVGMSGFLAVSYTQEGCRKQIEAAFDEEAAAKQLESFLEELNRTKVAMADLVEDLNLHRTGRLVHPQIARKMKKTDAMVIKVRSEVVRWANARFLINSGAIYDDVAQIDELLAILNSNVFDLYIDREISGSGLPTQMVNMDEFSDVQEELKMHLGELRAALDGIASPSMVLFSNNDLLNRKKDSSENPRKMLVNDFLAMDHVLRKEFNNADSVEIDSSLANFRKLIARLIKIRDDFNKNGTEISALEVRLFQAVLAKGGYYDYNKITGVYDKQTDFAFRQFWSDLNLDFNRIPKYLALE